MEQPAQDALTETYEVPSGLRHFLSVVRDSAHLDAKADLQKIEESLGSVAYQIAAICPQDVSHYPKASPQSKPLRCL